MKKKILIIEDDKALADMYKIELERRGFQVVTTPEGEEGVTIAKNEKPDLIVLDLLLPRMNGTDVLKVLKNDQTTKAIPVFILTNYDTPEEQEEEIKIGAEKYILKTNITPQQIGEMIEARLAAPK